MHSVGDMHVNNTFMVIHISVYDFAITYKVLLVLHREGPEDQLHRQLHKQCKPPMKILLH
jgi:hypothetical protein